MSAFKGTPGPWKAALDHNSLPIVWGPGMSQIAGCWHTPDGNGWRNARLIAAAPEILAALEECLAWMPAAAKHAPETPEIYEAISEGWRVIEKATGGDA